MPVTYSPFESKTGFKSPGFNVSPSGVLTTTTLDVNNLIVNGVPFGGLSGTLNIDGDFSVGQGSTDYVSVVNGQIILSNREDSVGLIDNVNIGSNIPGTGTFTSITTVDFGVPKFESNTNLELDVGNSLVFKVSNIEIGRVTNTGLKIDIVNSTIENTIIGNTSPTEGNFTEVNISNLPTTSSHATRKDYVDSKITAFSIALGA